MLQFYAVERGAGAALQTNVVVIWVAATTYFTAASAAVALIFDGNSGLKEDWNLLYWIPFPACAFAGYHMILFGTGAVRSRSIELVEDVLMTQRQEMSTLRADWQREPFVLWSLWGEKTRSKIGSRAETDWTNFDKATWPMKIISGIALSVPYFSALVLVILCLGKLNNKTGFENNIYTLSVILYVLYGLLIVALFNQSIRNLSAT
jgi:hypothetical protein